VLMTLIEWLGHWTLFLFYVLQPLGRLKSGGNNMYFILDNLIYCFCVTLSN
jgi:hypothetical protein